MSDYKGALKHEALVVNGPTLGAHLQPFSWTGVFTNTSHVGLPHTYNFDWQLMQPGLS